MPNLFNNVTWHTYAMEPDDEGRHLEFLVDMTQDPHRQLRLTINSAQGYKVALDEVELVHLEHHLRHACNAMNHTPVFARPDQATYSAQALAFRRFEMTELGELHGVIRWDFLYEPKRIVFMVEDHRGRVGSSIYLRASKLILLHDLSNLWRHQLIRQPDQPQLDEDEEYE